MLDTSDKNKQNKLLSLSDKIYLWVEDFLLTKIVPQKNPGPIFKYIFKIPKYMYRIGLGKLIGGRILILVTTGRKTGKQRETPLEYGYDEALNAYTVMAGWGGITDWYRNAVANPSVRIRLGGNTYSGVAEKLPDEEVAKMLKAITDKNPNAIRLWSRYSDEPVENTMESLLKASKYFPCLRIRINDPKVHVLTV